MAEQGNPESLFAAAMQDAFPGPALAVTPQAPDLPRTQRPAQNWILDPVQDALFIIAAPLLVLAVALLGFGMLGAESAVAAIILVHMVMTVAHHLPTFIRIYGDVDLFHRFKWTFLLGPLLPLAFSAGVLGYMAAKDVPVENFLYLFILLALWDPYHFLMQHYGFMRIYDRHNAAPRRLAARMDLLLCAAWFIFIMASSSEWLPGILEDLYRTVGASLALAVPPGAIHTLTICSGLLAGAATLAYVAYLLWCRRQGYFISAAKLALFAITFCVMYLTYVPNTLMQGLAPGWTFKAGFAAIGIVHMTQYLAIVWRYNRSIAARPGRARAGLFNRLHLRGGLLAAAGYVALCLAYGETLTGTHGGRWLMSIVMALGFTSTLLHYYFDGFIWKLRHQQNRENLSPAEPAGSPAQNALSWWSSGGGPGAGAVLLRHTLYFVAPMALLTAGAVALWQGPGSNYVGRMALAQQLYQQGHEDQARSEAQLALDSMEQQLPLARRFAELQPNPAHQAALAYLVYNHSRYHNLLLPTLAGDRLDQERLASYRADLGEAIGELSSAIASGGSLAHPGAEKLTAEEGRHALEKWQAELARLQGTPTPQS